MRGRAPLAAVVTAALSSIVVAALAGPPASAAPRPALPTAVSPVTSAADALQRAAGQSAQLGRRGSAVHAVAAPGRTLGRPAGVSAGASAPTVARAYLAQHGALFGVRDQARELRVERTLARQGRSAVRLRQLVGGLPVIGGELVVETRSGSEVGSVHGETTRSRPSTLRAAISAREAAKIAVRVGSRKGRATASGTASTPSLEVYDPALLGARAGVPDWCGAPRCAGPTSGSSSSSTRRPARSRCSSTCTPRRATGRSATPTARRR
jgi:hypothetical protein